MHTLTLWLLVSGAWLDITRLDDDTRLLVDGDGASCVTINRGRGDEQGAIPPTAVTGLRYLDRLNVLDGENPNSPYYRLIGQGTPVRFVMDGATRAEIELASVRTVNVPTADPKPIIEHSIDAAGLRMRLEGSRKPIVSAATRYYSRSTPWQWWAMETGSGVQVLSIPSSIPARDPATFEARTYLQALRASPASAGGSENARVSGAVAGDTTTGPPGSAGAVNLSGGGQLSATFPLSGPSLGLNLLIVEGWFMFSSPVETTGSGQVVRIKLTSETTIGFFVLPASVSGPAVFEIGSGSGEFISNSNSQITPDDGDWHHLVIELTRTGGISFDYVVSIDGEAYFASSTSATALLDITEMTLSPTGELGAVSQWAVWKDGYEPVDVLDGWQAGSGFAGFTPDGLIDHLLTEAGIETSASDPLDVLTETIEITAMRSGALMSQVDIAAAAGQHIVIDKRDEYDELRRIDRTTLYNQLPTATIRHEQLTGQLVSVNDSYDGRIVNDWTMTNDSGGSERYAIPDGDAYHWTTQQPPNGVGVRDRGESFPVVASNLRSLAAWYAHVNAWRERRFVNIEVNLSKLDSDYPDTGFTAEEIAALLELDVGRVIAIDTSDAPAYVPYNEVRGLVQGYEETCSAFLHTITYTTTPADIWEVDVTEFGPTALLANVMDDDDTTARIAPGDGPTPSVIEEYHISINGDPMTVISSSTATPAHVATGTAAYADNAAVVPSMPAGITPDTGQLLLLWATRRGTTATFAAPAGWTQITAQGAGYLFGRYYVTGDAAPTVTPSGGAAGTTIGAQIAAFSGLSMTVDKNVQDPLSTNGVSGQENASAQNVAYPYLDARRGSTAVLVFGKKDDDWTGVATLAGMTEVGDSSSTLGNDMGMAWYFDADGGVAPTVTAGSMTVTGGAAAVSAGMTVALRALQVATVTRAIAGVATSHTPGQEVHIWRPGAVAL